MRPKTFDAFYKKFYDEIKPSNCIEEAVVVNLSRLASDIEKTYKKIDVDLGDKCPHYKKWLSMLDKMLKVQKVFEIEKAPKKSMFEDLYGEEK